MLVSIHYYRLLEIIYLYFAMSSSVNIRSYNHQGHITINKGIKASFSPISH